MHDKYIEKLGQVRDIIEWCMWEEIDTDLEIPEKIINNLAELWRNLKEYLK
jgi:hypothetical protein